MCLFPAANSSSKKQMYDKLHPVSVTGTFIANKATSTVENSWCGDDTETQNHFELKQLNNFIEVIDILLMKRIVADFRAYRKYLEEDFEYMVDKLSYKGTAICKPDTLNGLTRMSFNIKLSNDGFLYSARTTVKVLHDNIQRHKHNDWCFLAKEEANQLVAGRRIAAELIGKVDTTQFFYNEHVNRVDLKYFNANTQDYVCITFEPGYPEVSFADMWLD